MFKIIVRHLYILKYIQAEGKQRRLILLKEIKQVYQYIDKPSIVIRETSKPIPGDKQSLEEICNQIGTQDDSTQKDKTRTSKKDLRQNKTTSYP